jgi:hypothetical protein
MTLSLDLAQVYDVECFPNCFTLTAEPLYNDQRATWEISDYRDDSGLLRQWFNWLNAGQIPMIGFNNESYDYAIIHFIWNNPGCSAQDIYAKNQAYFESQRKGDNFAHTIWPRDRFAPQIDLFKIHHFDNKAKTTNLKALEINMRAENVMESTVPFGQPVTAEQVDTDVIPYNCNDVSETKRFAHISMGAINFRIGLIDQFGVEVLNYNDTKIGEKMLEQRLGTDVCYKQVPYIDRFGNERFRKQKRQTVRSSIRLADIIFPYVQFTNPEFQRVHQFMLAQTLTPDDLDDPDATIKTKGVFTNLTAQVGGLTFYFGTGGVHASVDGQRFEATDEWPIRDIDVEGLYPRLAIVNRLAPEHLGEAFIGEYAKIPAERKTHAKGTYQNAALKLAANGAWGKSNSKYSVFYDPRYAMTIPINGQLLICMLAEWLLTVPTITLIQANTDGITYRIHRDYMDAAKAIERQWQDYTQLTLEDASYSRMWIRDVNNYIAEYTDGKLKQKGAYWHPDPLDYEHSISTASPPCWYKDLGNIVSVRAAVAAMVHGIDPAVFIRAHSDPFDFMMRAKVDRQSMLIHDDREVQRVTRYYVAREGRAMVKVSPPPAGAVVGAYKRKNGVSEADYRRVMDAGNWEWNADVCTGNKSRYEDRRTAIQAGWNVAICNVASHFRFDNVNYDFYMNEAKKLIIA